MTEREDFITSELARGRTREQTEAFLAIARSAFARCGCGAGTVKTRGGLFRLVWVSLFAKRLLPALADAPQDSTKLTYCNSPQ